MYIKKYIVYVKIYLANHIRSVESSHQNYWHPRSKFTRNNF